LQKSHVKETIFCKETCKGQVHGCMVYELLIVHERGGGLGSRPKKMYGERLGDGVEYHLM